MVRNSHLFQNFPEVIVIHTVKGFSLVNKAETEVFLELSCFFDDPNLISGSCAFSKSRVEHLELDIECILAFNFLLQSVFFLT